MTVAVPVQDQQAIEVVNYMELEKGHVLTQHEADCIGIVLGLAMRLVQVRDALGIEA